MEASARAQKIRDLLLVVENRRAVFEAILHRPGTHLRALCRDLGLAVGSVEHHLRQLQRHGLIFGHQEGRRRSYFACGSVGRDEALLLHALAHPARRSIARALLELEGASVADVAQHLGLDASMTSFHLRHLLRAKVVENVRAGRVSLYVLGDAPAVARALARTTLDPNENFATLLDSALQAPRAAPVVLRRTS